MDSCHKMASSAFGKARADTPPPHACVTCLTDSDTRLWVLLPASGAVKGGVERRKKRTELK